MKVESPGSVSGVMPLSRDGGRHPSERQDERGKDEGERRDRLSLFGIPEEEMTDAVRDAISRLIGDAVHLKSSLEAAERRIGELETLADVDPLVPVLNHRAFLRELDRLLALAERHGGPLSVLFVDVDGMKSINDRFGHAAGDAALLAVGTALVEGCRASDIVGRLGGDEFGIALPWTDGERARETAERLMQKIAAAAPLHDGLRIDVTASYGLYTARTGDRAADALAEADKDMYAQRRKGPGR